MVSKMTYSAVLRLQNLSWSANASDIREFFYGCEIPNGGVRIIGGDDGDCFVTFVKRADAQAALRKDRAILKDQQIRLYSSSEEEMRYIIAIAKGENPPKPASLEWKVERSRHENIRHADSARRDVSPFQYRNQQNENFGRGRTPTGSRSEDRPLGNKEVNDSRSRYERRSSSNAINEHAQSFEHGRYKPDLKSSRHSSSSHSEHQDRFSEFNVNSNYSAHADAYRAPSDESKYESRESPTFSSAGDSRQIMRGYEPNNSGPGNFIAPPSSEWMANQDLPGNSGPPLQNERSGQSSHFANNEPSQVHDKRDFNSQQRVPTSQNNHTVQTFNPSNRDVQQMRPPSPYNPSASSFGSLNLSRGDNHDRFQENQKKPHFSSYPNSTQGPHGSMSQNEAVHSRSFMNQMPKPVNTQSRDSFHSHITQPANRFNEFIESDAEPSRKFNDKDENNFGRRGFPSARGAPGTEGRPQFFSTMGNPLPTHDQPAIPRPPQFLDVARRADLDQRHSPSNFRRHLERGDQSIKMSPTVDRDSDLRSASNSSLKGRPATASKSIPLLPTPGEPPTVPALLDVKLASKGEPDFSNRGPLRPPFVPNPDMPPAKKIDTAPANMRERQLFSGMALPRANSSMVAPFGSGLSSVQHDEIHGFSDPIGEPRGQIRHTNDLQRDFDSQNIVLPQNLSHIPLQHQRTTIHHPNRSQNVVHSPDEVPLPVILPPPIRQRSQQAPFHHNLPRSIPQPESIVPSIKEVTDPCAYFTNLPGNIQYKQLRGLFATHNIIALDIKICWPRPFASASEMSEAVVLFDTVDGTVLALNELKGSKIMGFVINIEPCSKSVYSEFSQTPDRNPKPHGQFDNSRKMNEPVLPRGVSRLSPDRPRFRDADTVGRDFSRASRRSRSPPTRELQKRRSRSPFRRLNRRSRSPIREPYGRRSRSPNRARSPRNSERDRHRLPARNSDRDVPKTDSRPVKLRRLGDRAEFRMGDHPDSKPESHSATDSVDVKNLQDKPPKAKDSLLPKPSDTVNPASATSWPTVLTGLPPKSTMSDVEQFLTDIQYDPSSLYLEFNVHGECTGTAYVELTAEHSLRMLMNSPKELLQHTIQVNPIVREHMVAAIALHKQNLSMDKTTPGEFVLQFMGLPPDASPRTVSEFLYPTKIKENEVTVVKLADGRCSGTGFVKVHSLADREEALKHDRGYIGKRYVTIRVVSEQVMNDLISKQNGKAAEVKPPIASNSSRAVRMVNLRYDIMPEQVESFFRDYNPERGSVQFSMNNGMPTGKGTIRLKTAAEASKAVEELNKMELAGRPILLSLTK